MTYTLNEMHRLYLNMIAEFHQFCVDHDLIYYMVGGTLLGAVRHHGFIPWDDDVDFAMPRGDYERFIASYSGNMRLESFKRNKDFMFPYVKLMNTEMPYIEIKDDDYHIESCAFFCFDIYPIDGLGDDKRNAEITAKKVGRIKRLLYLNMTEDQSPNLAKRAITAAIRKLPTSWLLCCLDAMMSIKKNGHSKYVTRWRASDPRKIVVENEVFGKPVLLSFEELNLFAPAEYNKYLAIVYGDYMTPKQEDIGLRHDVNQSCIAKKLKKYLEQ